MSEDLTLPRAWKKTSQGTKKKLQEARRVVPQPVVEAVRFYHEQGMSRKLLMEKFVGLSGDQISNITNNRTYTY